MAFVQGILGLITRINTGVLALGRNLGWIAMMAMVLIILTQVFFRYVLNSALPWPEEAARAFMIWMMALVAPSAYRWGGFVSIDLLADALPRVARNLLLLAIFALSLVVLIIMLGHAWTHYSSPILFNSSGLNRLLQDSGINELLGTNLEFRTSYIYLAMSVCLAMMISVSCELILRLIGRMMAGEDAFPTPDLPVAMGNE
ncbi:MAG: TRAP transporter small permease subunit [Pseudomonadota bacterium]